MANIKSAKKRIRVSEKKTLINKMIKSRTRTAMKKVLLAVKEANKDLATKALVEAVSVIDKAATKGVYHKNNAARKKSRLSKLVNAISA